MSTYALFAMSVELLGVVLIVPLVKVVAPVTASVVLTVAAPVTVSAPVATVLDSVVAPVTPSVVLTVAAPVTLSAPVATARPAVKLAMDTFTVVEDCTIGKTSVPATGVVAAVKAEIFVCAMLVVNCGCGHSATDHNVESI